jgi:Lysyl oxidase/Bacterial Ig domain
LRRPRLALANRCFATIAVAGIVLAIVPGSAAFAADLLPDLVATAPTNPQLSVTTLDDGQDHFLVRFDAALRNIGAGPLEIRGSNPVNGVMTVTGQRIYDDNGHFRDDNSQRPVIRFESADGHHHWHVQNAARYSLWNEAGTAEAGVGAKVGFCLEDGGRFDSSAPGDAYSSNATSNCEAGQPNAPSVFQGITPGWQDVYGASLRFQWVDLSDVAPGRYRLGETVDPTNFAVESNKSNNGPALASDIVTVPGWAPSSATVTAAAPQTTILLGAQRYGSSTTVTFKIESAPEHGKLSAPLGAALPGSQVVYTPNPGFEGNDTFTFSARDPSSAFPLHSPMGTVTVKVPGSPVHAFKKLGPVHAFKKLRLLTKLRFSRNGRFLTVRGRAQQTGMLKIQIKKDNRKLGSCTKRGRSNHGFRCRIQLRKGGSAVGARGVVSLLVNGQPTAVDTFRVPRRLHR